MFFSPEKEAWRGGKGAVKIYSFLIVSANTFLVCEEEILRQLYMYVFVHIVLVSLPVRDYSVTVHSTNLLLIV